MKYPEGAHPQRQKADQYWPGVGGGKMEISLFNEHGIFFWTDANVLEINRGGHNIVTTWMTLNCTF